MCTFRAGGSLRGLSRRALRSRASAREDNQLALKRSVECRPELLAAAAAIVLGRRKVSHPVSAAIGPVAIRAQLENGGSVR